MLRLAFLFTILWGSFVVSQSTAGELPGPREPLTFRDHGLYCGWNEYFLRADTPFDFYVVGVIAQPGQDHSKWRDNLARARQQGKRVIAVLIPQAKQADGTLYHVHAMTEDNPETPLDALVDVAGEFLSQVGEENLYAVSLGEEHIFWNGRAELLNAFYDKLKAKHDIPVFQWYSPSTHGSTPGVTGWPNLKADGWISDEYHLDAEEMERAMRAYRVLRKPIVHIAWAGANGLSVPYVPERFAAQVEVCRKYDIPMGYFTWSGKLPWGWDNDAPPELAERFQRVLNTARDAQNQPSPQLRQWDETSWETPTIELAFDSIKDQNPGYVERYDEDRTLRFVNDAEIQNFADLRWDSSAVELRPRQTGAATSSVTYKFSSAFAISELRVRVAGFLEPNANASVELAVLDADGSTIAATSMENGAAELKIPAAKLNGREFQVLYRLQGTAQAANQTLAGVRSLNVEAEVALPNERRLDIPVATNGAVRFEKELSDLSFVHTAEVHNAEKIRPSTSGLFANESPKPLEVVQCFVSERPLKISTLTASGRANEKVKDAKMAVGFSLNGVDVLAKETSSGTFSGDLKLPVNLETPTNKFYVHLFLEGSYGLIESYSIDGEAN